MHTSRRTLIQGLLIGTTGLAAGAWSSRADRRNSLPGDSATETTPATVADVAQAAAPTEVAARWPSPFGYAMSLATA
jgi:hypothetical protein